MPPAPPPAVTPPPVAPQAASVPTASVGHAPVEPYAAAHAPAPAHAPAAAHTAAAHGEAHEEENVGQIDVPAWAAGLLGAAVALFVTACFVLATAGLGAY